MSKKAQKTTTRWASYLPAALVALGGLALVAVVVAVSSGRETSESAQRPYVGGDLHSLAVDPTNPDKVMVGGHEGGAISEDAGKSWREAFGMEGADPMGWEVDPTDPRKMYAGGHPGFLRSGDGGESWTRDNAGLPGTDVHGLGMDPQDPETLYAYVVDEGLLRSRDAGESWKLVNGDFGAMGPILVDPRESDTLYLAGMDGRFRRSDDGGKSWRKLGAIPGRMVMSSSQDRKHPGTFYAAGGGVFKSTDGGESWRPVGDGLPQNVSVVAVAQGDPNVVYAGARGSDGGSVFRSDDGGGSWEAQN